MKRFLKTVCAVALAGLSLLSAPAQAQDKNITMGTMSWDDLTPITAVTKKVLEDAGYTVKVTTFAEWGIAFAALSKGDVQLMASQLNYVAQDHWDKNKSRLEKVSPVSHGLYQAFAVPKYVPIDSIEQLNANADKIGNKLVGIEPGSGLMREAAAISAARIDDPAVLEERREHPGRLERAKLRDPLMLRQTLATSGVLAPPQDALVIDTTQLAAGETAARIAATLAQ